MAASNGNEGIVKLLLATERVNVNSQDYSSRYTPLSEAARNGHVAVVKLLLATDGVDLHLGDLPLGCAAQNGHEEIVKLLLATKRVDVNSRDRDGETALLEAASYGHLAPSNCCLL